MMSGYIGIDVAKAELVVARDGVEKQLTYPNTDRGHRDLVKDLEKEEPRAEIIVLEATGGYERGVVAALGSAGLPAVVVNPRQVRDFAKATGQLAKTDAIDAQVLAQFAARVRPEIRPLQSEEQEDLRELLVRQQQVMQMVQAEHSRFLQAVGKGRQGLRKRLKKHISFLELELKLIDSDMDDMLKESSIWREADDLLQSVPGIGEKSSRILLGFLPELGTVSSREIARLAGLAPLNHDSGTMRGKRRTGGGRTRIRAVLYMATLASIRYNPTIQLFYKRLIGSGKAKMVAVTACTRKLLVILNAMMKTKTRWQAQITPTTA
jgi:transposase